MKFQFSIRDLLLIVVIAALAAGWWIDHQRINRPVVKNGNTIPRFRTIVSFRTHFSENEAIKAGSLWT